MSIEEKEGRHGRSVRLTTSINTRLINLCEHLGVTPNSYLVQVIGKAITLDEQAYVSTKNSNSMINIASDIRDSMNGDMSEIMSLLNEPDVQEFLINRKNKIEEEQSELDLS